MRLKRRGKSDNAYLISTDICTLFKTLVSGVGCQDVYVKD